MQQQLRHQRLAQRGGNPHTHPIYGLHRTSQQQHQQHQQWLRHQGQQHRLRAQAQEADSQDKSPTPTTTAETASPASPAFTSSPGGFLSTPDQQAAAYGFLSATSLAFGAVALAAPELLLSVAVGGGDASTLDVAFTRIAGATMAISAAAEYSIRVSGVACLGFGCWVAWESNAATDDHVRTQCACPPHLTSCAGVTPSPGPHPSQDAVLAGHLKSATYQRLMVAVIAKSSLYLAAFLLVSAAAVAV